MNFLTDYWQQLTAFIMLVVILTRMRVDIDVLKEKVMTIFELWNNKREKQMDWITSNWTLCVAIFWMLEKVVKLTPFPYDDILLDMVWGSVKKALNKK